MTPPPKHEVKLGTLPVGHQCRDAIHIAVAPVTSDETLQPGQHIALVPGTTDKVRADIASVGIVDPFLNHGVAPGQQFWMLLYPQTITSLRHEWTHPAFASAPNEILRTKAESEAWLREFVRTKDCPDYDTLIAAASGQKIEDVEDVEDGHQPSYANDGEYFTFYGRDAHADIPPEFWDHVEIVTGIKIPTNKRASSFSCSC